MSASAKWFAGFAALFVGVMAIFLIFGEKPAAAPNPGAAGTQTDISQPSVSRNKRVEGKPLEFQNTGEKVAYLGDENCAGCHFQETDSFRRHPMGRSMVSIDQFAAQHSKQPFLAENYRYSVEKRDGKTIHIEEELDRAGKVVKRTEEPVSLVVGSGTRGHAFLLKKADKLFQSPVSWYSSLEKYGLAPGYQRGNLHFSRQIRQPCLHCHANQVEARADDALSIHGLAIGCERCHGPGELHDKTQKMVDGYDHTIVNPARLTPTRRDQVCYQCHLQLDARQEIPGKDVTQFRPGLDLNDFIKRSPASFTDPIARLNAVSHVQGMEDSRCYQESAGKMGCFTCHNPHDYQPPAQRTKTYIKQCLTCHSGPAQKECALPAPTRLAKSPDDNCLACHMPSRNTTDIGHTALTDHSIKRVTPAYELMNLPARTPNSPGVAPLQETNQKLPQ